MLSTELPVSGAGLVSSSASRIEAGEPSWSPDWSIVRRERLHALVIGSRAATDAALSRAFPDVIWADAVWTSAHRPERFRAQIAVVRDAQELTDIEQEQLLAWMDRYPAIQIVTVADRPLYPLVAAGLFRSALYYRLNIFYFVF
jgi:hypothetical protein